MSHVIIIGSDGTGPGGSAKGSIEWTPSHDLSGNEQMKRVNKAHKLMEKANDVLYGTSSEDSPDPGP